MEQDILKDYDYQKSVAKTLQRCFDKGLVDAKDKNFVKSLLTQHTNKGTLSDKQWPWVEKMMVRAMGIDEAEQPTIIWEAQLNADKLFAMFDVVKEKLKKPSLLFVLNRKDSDKHKEIKVYPDGANLGVCWANVYPGYLGTIYPSGKFSFSKYTDEKTQPLLAALFSQVCHDPKAVLAAHGKILNKCCFCNKTLSDPISVKLGYGPTCATNWHMPYSHEAAMEVALDDQLYGEPDEGSDAYWTKYGVGWEKDIEEGTGAHLLKYGMLYNKPTGEGNG